MAVTLFTRTLVVDYHADVSSFTFLIWFLGSLIIWVVPIFIIYGTGKVWDPVEYLASHQAKINYKYDFIMKATVKDDGSFVFYSTRQGINDLYADFLRMPTIRVTEFDVNNDRVKDKLEMELNLPMRTGEVMHKMEMMMMFQYHLEQANFEMESMAYFEVVPDLPRSSIVDLVGNLRLVQSQTLPIVLDDHLLNASVINDSSSFEFFSTLLEYQSRIVRTEFKMLSQTTRMSSDNNSFVANVVINYQPQSNIVAKVCIFRLSKWIYIQYVYIVLIFLIIIMQLNKYIFVNKLVPYVSRISLR